MTRVYPVDMRSMSFIKLKTHVLNEGKILLGKKIVRILGYANQDPILLQYFVEVVKKAGGSIKGEPRLETHKLVVYANPVLARALNASGLPFGRKTRTNPPIDPHLKQDRELFRYHIKSTLTEELASP